MSVAGKLQIRAGDSVAILHAPAGVEIDLPEGSASVQDASSAGAVLVFVEGTASLAARRDPLVAAARRDALAWAAYPKGGRLGTDLNRDSLARLLEGSGIRPVRQVSIDDVWSALRFRPAGGAK